MTQEIPITIIGGGVVGCAIAHELSKRTSLDIVVLERNPSVTRGENQSSRNSGVVHAGIYYPKATMPLKAGLCVKGNERLYDFCTRNEIPCQRTGKLVVANDATDEKHLNEVLKIAHENGVCGEHISAADAARLEPNVRCISALFFPSSGVIDSAAFVRMLKLQAESRGVSFIGNAPVTAITADSDGFMVTPHSQEPFRTRTMINAAGLYSDCIAQMVNMTSSYEITPVRGEWARFYMTRDEIRMRGLNVYPAPYGIWPSGERAHISFTDFQQLLAEGRITRSIGIHLSPTFDLQDGRVVIGNTVIVGPTSQTVTDKEDYRSVRDEQYFLDRVRSYFPNLDKGDLGLHQSGIRAKLRRHPDFVIARDSQFPQCINLVGIDSPGFTCSLAIGNYVAEMVCDEHS